MNDDIQIIDEIMTKYIASTTKTTFFHYTSPEAFKSIIENKQLWFSEVHYLNDKSEIEYTSRLVLDILDSRKDLDTDFSEQMSLRIRSNRKNLTLALHSPARIERRYYIASFSTAPDELSLWNYYTKNSNKGGYNIGFNAKKLMNLVVNERKNNKRMMFGKVIYTKKRQSQLINFILDKFNEKYVNTKDDSEKTLLIIRCSGFMNTLSLFFKDNSFAAEKEYRFVFIDYNYRRLRVNENVNNNKSYRILNGIFIPYIKQDFTSDIIESVTVSPLIDFSMRSGLDEFLIDNGLKIKINKSKIPLRY